MADETFFNPHQRATIAAAMARIIPTDDMPGAREAGCIDFVDRYLSGIGFIYAKPDGSGFETLTGRAADAWRRRIDILRRRYVDGVADLDERARATFSAPFSELHPEQQETILRALEAGRSPAETTAALDRTAEAAEPALQQTSTEIDLDFFPLLVAHTRQGYYCDPIYGGNRDRAGWTTIGFDGPTSLKAVHEGRYTTLQYFAEGEAEKVREFHDGL
ncbi:gluconate 2-dehydrogenase subunit 3 family protein [Jiella sp. M17.18]|uniref:gluconate 2-dehydrogenase subunit 3 family protein n=1 Tax=Jiella sp. M17.18 TaxID=3234247 RepID=UPI0034E03727